MRDVEGDRKGSHVKPDKRERILLQGLFIVYIGGILWITLLSRVGSNSTGVLKPFWSYREIIYGNVRVYKETVLNILLFIPLGLFLGAFFSSKSMIVVAVGLLSSLLIECCQLLFKIGIFEIDDVVNNSLGAYIGLLIWELYENYSQKEKLKVRNCILPILFAAMLVMIPISIMRNNERMMNFAQMNDSNTGIPDLLILNGERGYVRDTNAFLEYREDGSLQLSGKAQTKAWKAIGDITLPEGRYCFSGVIKADASGLFLDYFNENIGAYTRLTNDIGEGESITFTLDRKTKIRAYIIVYPRGMGESIVRPVIYQEE